MEHHLDKLTETAEDIRDALGIHERALKRILVCIEDARDEVRGQKQLPGIAGGEEEAVHDRAPNDTGGVALLHHGAVDADCTECAEHRAAIAVSLRKLAAAEQTRVDQIRQIADLNNTIATLRHTVGAQDDDIVYLRAQTETERQRRRAAQNLLANLRAVLLARGEADEHAYITAQIDRISELLTD